jgi:hypothetical protein
MTLELPPEMAAALEALASVRGLTAQGYLRELVAREFPAPEPDAAPAEGGVRMVDELPIHHSSHHVPDYVVSRAIERSREDQARHLFATPLEL